MRPRTVLIFAHECAPYNRPESTAGAQRPAAFAKYLPEFGWRAIVLCCDASQRRSTGPESVATAAEGARQILHGGDPSRSVVIPTPSLRWDGLLDRCWFAYQQRPAASRAPLLWLRRALTAAKTLRGDYSQSWQPVARAVAEAVAGEVAVGVCLGAHSPDAGIFLARWFAARHGLPWVADFRDPVLWPFRGLGRRVYASVIRRLVRTASATVNVTPAWADADRLLFDLPSHCIPNGYDPEDFGGPSATTVNAVLTIVYAGRIDQAQRLEPFLAGLALAKSGSGTRTDCAFVYRGPQADAVRSLSARYGVAEMTDARAWSPREQVIMLMRGADLLLLLSTAEPKQGDPVLRQGFYPAKVFEYFGARRPILCVPGDGALLDRLLTETRTGAIRRTPEEIASYLQEALECWRVRGKLPYSPDAAAVERFSRRRLAGLMAEVLDQALGGRTATVRV